MKSLRFCDFYECVTDQPTDQATVLHCMRSVLFSRGHATLHLAESVRPSVRPSVTFLNSDRFSHYCSWPTVRDWIAVHPALLPIRISWWDPLKSSLNALLWDFTSIAVCLCNNFAIFTISWINWSQRRTLLAYVSPFHAHGYSFDLDMVFGTAVISVHHLICSINNNFIFTT